MGENTIDLKKSSKELDGHSGAIYKLIKKDQGFISGGSDGLIVYWQKQNFTKGRIIAKLPDTIFCIETWITQESDGTIKDHLVCGTMSGDLFWMDLNDQNATKRWRFHKGIIYALLKIDHFLYVCGADGVLSLWNTQTKEMEKSTSISKKGIRAIIQIPETDTLIIGDQLGNLFCIEHKSLRIKQRLNTAHNGSIFCIDSTKCVSKDVLIFSGGIDGKIRSWVYDNGLKQDDLFAAHSSTINDLKISTNKKVLFSVSRDRTCKKWIINKNNSLFLDSTYKGEASINTVLVCEHNLFIAGDNQLITYW